VTTTGEPKLAAWAAGTAASMATVPATSVATVAAHLRNDPWLKTYLLEAVGEGVRSRFEPSVRAEC
jgi:hypothetical protein